MLSISKTIKTLAVFYILLISGCSLPDSPINSSTDSFNRATHIELNTKMRQMQVRLTSGCRALIYYQKPEWKRYAHQIEFVLQKAALKIETFINIPPGLYTEVILMEENIFREKITKSPWVSAAFHKGRIFIPINDKKPRDLKNLKDTITHELTHAVISDLTKGHAPGWLDEGLALLIEGKDMSGPESRYQDWLKYNQPLSIDKLSAGFTHMEGEDAGFAYVQSKLLVKRLLDDFGKEKMNGFLIQLGKLPVTESFLTAFKISWGEYFADYL